MVKEVKPSPRNGMTRSKKLNKYRVSEKQETISKTTSITLNHKKVILLFVAFLAKFQLITLLIILWHFPTFTQP